MATDDFNRANSGTLGANWTATQNNMGIESNEAAPQSNGVYNFVYYSAVSLGNEHSSQGIYRSHGGALMTLQVRHQSGGDLYMLNLSATSGLKIFKYVTGGFTELADLSTAIVDGHTYKFKATGASPTTLRVYDNGAEVGSGTTDSTGGLQSGGAPGIGGADAAGGWDDWVGADEGAVAPRFILGTH